MFYISHKSRSEKGIALLLVLWVLTILMVIVLSFSFMARTETYSTISFKEGMDEKFMAEAGIERGIMELFYRNTYKNQSIEFEEREIWNTDGTLYFADFGGGQYAVRITDESGKIDINTVSDVLLKNLLVNVGIETETETETYTEYIDIDTIVDSIMDWKDPDDLHRLNGAENDYYMSLPNPYSAKNAPFDTIEELIIVRGMNPEILYGTNEKRGIIDFLTVNSKSSGININAAPKEVLMAIPGVTSEIADAIIEYRQFREIFDLADIQGIPQENMNFMFPHIDTGGSNMFTIDAIGYKGNKKGGYAIRATVTISGTNQYKYVYYKSPTNIKQ